MHLKRNRQPNRAEIFLAQVVHFSHKPGMKSISLR